MRTNTAAQPGLSFLECAGEMGAMIRDFDWTKTPIGPPENWPENLRVSTSILLNSQFPMFVWWGPEMITIYNDAYRVILGDKHPNALGNSGPEVWAEIWDIVGPLADKVMEEGTSNWSEDLILYMNRHGYVEETYFTFSYSPIYDTSGEVVAVFCACTETTEKVLSAKKIKESEANFRKLVINAPVGICIVTNEDNYVEVVNDQFLQVVGRNRQELENQPYWKALKEAEVYYAPILQNVFESGTAYAGSEHKVLLTRNGVREYVYINFVYEPMRDEQGTVSKVMILAIDVTPQVLVRRKIEEAEERARLSIEISQLGSYEVDFSTDTVVASKRMNEIFGITDYHDRNSYIQVLHKDDLSVREEAYKIAFTTGTLNYDARIVHKDGTLRWVRIRGRVLFDQGKKPIRLLGVSQDITEQKLFEQELNKQVQQKTIELQNKNAELERSNHKLEEFAHAASHDLKEPIRKVHFFTNQLKDQLLDRLTDLERSSFQRIEIATQRMNLLVDDLLQYSHVSHVASQQKEWIDLNEKLQKVLEDLELDIQQKNAVIEVKPLPSVLGYTRQLQQLFQNLISNALKYSKPNARPHIIIEAKKLNKKDAPGKLPKSANANHYHLITVSDNGIGFEQEYAERIFQMFQRLHGKNEYGGTGVGLAIALKVAENHEGTIIAEGKPGKGSAFKIFLPMASEAQ
ncbi:MAG TPA: PAS domain S-box protein [Flavisolibacter sp.]|jgi:PAS domain S-box-containing protein|nr:PAS domain S-box protein [Flavisolibacter sp.]